MKYCSGRCLENSPRSADTRAPSSAAGAAIPSPPAAGLLAPTIARPDTCPICRVSYLIYSPPLFVRTTTMRMFAHAILSPIEPTFVTITPYLSRDTTYCYRHCKGISRFPLLLHHPSPRPMPDRTTSTSLTFAYVIMPYRTHASNPHHVYCLTDSFVPLISLPHSPSTSL